MCHVFWEGKLEELLQGGKRKGKGIKEEGTWESYECILGKKASTKVSMLK